MLSVSLSLSYTHSEVFSLTIVEADLQREDGGREEAAGNTEGGCAALRVQEELVRVERAKLDFLRQVCVLCVLCESVDVCALVFACRTSRARTGNQGEARERQERVEKAEA
eukprot:804627-Rhodomonas_salina.1